MSKGQWFVEKDTRVHHSIADGLVQIFVRTNGGWFTPQGKNIGRGAHPKLIGQVRVEDVEQIIENHYLKPIHEVAVVGLDTGQWQTIWATDESKAQYLDPPVKRKISKLRDKLKSIKIHNTELHHELKACQQDNKELWITLNRVLRECGAALDEQDYLEEIVKELAQGIEELKGG